MSNKKLHYLIFGTLPPPYGGVTISIQNLINSLHKIGHSAVLVSKSNLFSFKKFDIAHIHYSKKWKVLSAILIGKFLAKKTIVTKHGAGFYPQKSMIDKAILHLCDGMIVLNKEVYQRCKSKKHICKLPPIFKEGVIIDKKMNKSSYLKKEESKKHLLLYASRKVFIDNKEVYGVYFILNLLSKLNPDIHLVFLDPTGEYREDLKELDNSKITYIDEYVDFKSLVEDVDLYIRPTSSDGNSIATLESLSVGTPVLASDIVERDENITTYIYFNENDFIEKLNKLLYSKEKLNRFQLTTITQYTDFCQNVLDTKA